MNVLPGFGKAARKAMVDAATSLDDLLVNLAAMRDERIAEATREWDIAVAPVKHILDAMPEALKVKASADKKYAQRVLPVWESWEYALGRVKARWKKRRAPIVDYEDLPCSDDDDDDAES